MSDTEQNTAGQLEKITAMADSLFGGTEKTEESNNPTESEQGNNEIDAASQTTNKDENLEKGAEGSETTNNENENNENPEEDQKDHEEDQKEHEEDQNEHPAEEQIDSIPGALLSNDENASPVREPSQEKSSPRHSPVRYAQTQPVAYRNSIASDYNKEDIERAIEEMLTHNKVPDQDDIPSIRLYLEDETREAALTQQYEQGAKLERASQLLDQLTATDDNALSIEKKQEEARKRHEIAKQNYDKLVKEWDERIAQSRQYQQEKITELENEHKNEIEKFEEQWAQPENMLEYNKPSSQLIRLRTTEQNLALQKQFDRAKAVKLQADKLQKEEIDEAKRKAVADMKLAYQVMDQRQKREMECLLQRTQANIEYLEKERNKVITPMHSIVQRHQENSRPKTARSRGIRASCDDLSKSSPRPIRTKIPATTIRPALQLGLSGINVRDYIKPNRSTQNLSRRKE